MLPWCMNSVMYVPGRALGKVFDIGNIPGIILKERRRLGMRGEMAAYLG